MGFAIRESFLLVVILGLLLPSEAYAYLDPGTGSLLIQSILAGLAAAAYAVRTNWDRLTRIFKGSRGSSEPDQRS